MSVAWILWLTNIAPAKDWKTVYPRFNKHHSSKSFWIKMESHDIYILMCLCDISYDFMCHYPGGNTESLNFGFTFHESLQRSLTSSHQQPIAKKHVAVFNEVTGFCSRRSWEDKILCLTCLTRRTCFEAHSQISHRIVSLRPNRGKLINVMFRFFVWEVYCKCFYMLFLN